MADRKYLCDLIIPTYNEKGYIERTLFNLVNQNLYKKGKVHIAIGDYKNELNMDDTHLYDLCKKHEDITYIPLFSKGIPHARNTIIKECSKTDIIVNFDADSIFDRPDAIEKMIDPILNKEVKLTNCETLFFDFDTNKIADKTPTNIYEYFSNIGSLSEKLIFARGPGLTVAKDVFYSVGGFRDIPIGEDYFLAFDVCWMYSYQAKRFINDVKVYTSNRRARSSKGDGLAVFDYKSNYYR